MERDITWSSWKEQRNNVVSWKPDAHCYKGFYPCSTEPSLSGCPHTVNIHEKQGETKCDSVALVPLVLSSCDLTENFFLFSRGSETVTFTLNFFYLGYIITTGGFIERGTKSKREATFF